MKKVNKDVISQEIAKANEDAKKTFFQARDKKDPSVVSEELNIEAKEKARLYDESLALVPISVNVMPMFNSLFLTAKRNKVQTDSGLFLPTASFSDSGSTDLEQDFADTQIVMSVGPQVQQVMVGMEVKLNIESFRKRLTGSMSEKVQEKSIIEYPIEVIDGVEYIKINERDISYISNRNGCINLNS